MADLSLRRIFAVPLVLQALTLLGLVAALLGDGVWDGVSWLALAVPLLVILRHVWRVK